MLLSVPGLLHCRRRIVATDNRYAIFAAEVLGSRIISLSERGAVRWLGADRCCGYLRADLQGSQFIVRGDGYAASARRHTHR